MTKTSTSLLVAFFLAVSPASADPESDARALFNRGRDLFRNGDYRSARAAFEEANRILPNPRVYGNIAACYEGERNFAAAVRTYRRFVYEGGDGIAAEARQGAERAIVRLRTEVGDLVFAVEPVGAEIRVEGEVVGSAPLPWPVAVAPGARLVEIRAYEHTPYSRTVDVAAGAQVQIQAVLDRARAPESEPEPEPESQPEREPEPEPEPRPTSETPLGRGPLLWAGIGLTSVLVIGGTVTGLLALSAESGAQDESLSLSQRQSEYDTANRLATVTDVLVDGAVVVGLATLALYVFAGPDEEAPPGTGTALLSPTIAIGGSRCDLRLFF